MFIKFLSAVYGFSPGHAVPFLQMPGKTTVKFPQPAVETRRVFPGSQIISTYRSCKMKKLFRQTGIAGTVLVIGVIFMGCATTGGTARFDPPDGTYYNYHQGNISFNSADSSWEAMSLGYRGSFNYDEETSGITLTAEQELRGFQWEDIDPVRGFSSGQMEGDFLTLGDFRFRNLDE
jgi:hypothetical protein